MKKQIAVILILVLCPIVSFAGVGSKNAQYVGGTITTVKEGAEGKVSAADEKNFVFSYKSTSVLIPYDRINSLEYGQKAGRRIGVAIIVSPIALLSKKRKHYLTLNYLDDQDKQQAMVLELGKDIVRVILSTLEAWTGRKIEYQDDEARESGK